MILTPTPGPPPISGADESLKDLRVRVAAAAKTVELLVPEGLRVQVTEGDRAAAAAITTAYAANPEATSKVVSQSRMGNMTPAALRAIDAQLREFSHKVVESSVQLRHFVTNKLIEESDNPDPRVRIKALELLGKIGDVGLFAEKTEVTVTHQTTADLRNTLREKLLRMSAKEDVLDAEVIEDAPKVIDAETLLSAWDEGEKPK